MKFTGFFVALFLAFFMVRAPAFAANPCGVNPCADKMHEGYHKDSECKTKGHHKKGNYNKKRMNMMSEHMGMMKEVLIILRDLKHKPSKAQKKRLGEMIERLEEKESRMKEHMQKKKDK